MKKPLLPLLSAALLIMVCTACVSPAQSSSVSPIESTGSSQITYDPFAQPDMPTQNNSTTIGNFGLGVAWENGKELTLTYAPTVSFRYYTENNGDTADFGLLLFVNGFRQPYRTEHNAETRTLHTFEAAQNTRLEQTISFEPVVGTMGDTLSVEIISMFRPGFLQEDTSNYEFNHRILSLLPSALQVTEHTDRRAPQVCEVYETQPITEALRLQFDEKDASGAAMGNKLDRSVFLETLKNDTFYSPQDRLNGLGDQTPFTEHDTVTLCMYGGKTPCKYRVSMYVDHELVTGAFDGADYLDMEVSREQFCQKQIAADKLDLQPAAAHHLYFIAVPIYAGADPSERMVLKSASVRLRMMQGVPTT